MMDKEELRMRQQHRMDGLPCKCVFLNKTLSEIEKLDREEVFGELSGLLVEWMEKRRR
jgi:hypothetical protein